MAYKSKDKYLERDGKTFSYCHIDPQSGSVCTTHKFHESPAKLKKLMSNLNLSVDDVQELLSTVETVSADDYFNHNAEEEDEESLTPEEQAERKLSSENYNAYYTIASNALNSIAEIVMAHDNNSYDSETQEVDGRSGSEAVEKVVIKPILKEPETLQKIKDKLAEDGFILDHIEDVEDSAITDPTLIEANKRAWVDVVLHGYDSQGNTITIPVNIKSTTGKGTDNVGGWKALSHVLVGEDIKREMDLLSYLKENGIKETTEASDYFLWTFYKTESKPLGSSNTTSLLSMTPESLTINLKQSMPLQVKAENVRLHDEYLSMGQRRALLIDYMLGKTIETTNKKLKIQREVLNKVKEGKASKA
jgi:hypothetical protein